MAKNKKVRMTCCGKEIKGAGSYQLTSGDLTNKEDLLYTQDEIKNEIAKLNKKQQEDTDGKKKRVKKQEKSG